MVVGQVAVVFILLIGAGLLLRSLQNVYAVDPGFDAERVVQGRLELRGMYKYNETISLRQRVLAAIKEIPGVESVSLMPYESFRVFNAENTRDVVVRGRSGEAELMVRHLVTADFFATMGIPVVEGRVFQPADDKSVYVVDELFAERYLDPGTAVGSEIYVDNKPPGSGQQWSRVVGVVARANLRGLEQRDGLPVAYTFLNDQTGNWVYTILVRTNRPAGPILQEMAAKVRAIDPRLPLFGRGALHSALDRMLLQRTGLTWLAVGFAVLALVLSVAGLYGVLAYNVQSRRRELGIRLALGATRRRTLAGVVRDALSKTAAGLAIGLACSAALSPSLRSHLFDVEALDLTTYVGSTLVLCLAALAASLVPAMRAVTVDPSDSLRAE